MEQINDITQRAIIEIMAAVNSGYYTQKEDITKPNLAEVVSDWLNIYIEPEIINDWDLYEKHPVIIAVSKAFKMVEKILYLK